MKKPFLSKLLKQVFFALGAVVAAALILELGFRLRDWRQSLALTPPASGWGAKTVLLIGDSVLGTPDSGISRYLEADLGRDGGESFIVRNLSRPRNSSAWVESYLSNYLREYHPQYAILLLGKSDSPEFSTEERTGWRGLRIFRLYRLAAESAMKLVKRWKHKSPRSPGTQLGRLKLLRDWYVLRRHEAIDALVSLPMTDALKESKKYYAFCLALALKTRERPQLFPQAEECMRDLEKSEIPAAYLSSIKFEVARGLSRLGKVEEAGDMLLEAIHLDAENALAQMDLGFLFSGRHECAKAIPYFENALRKVRRSASETCFRLYNCFVAEKREQEGEAFFKELSRSRPEICPERVATGLRGQRAGYADYHEQISAPQTRSEFMEKLFYFRQRYDTSSTVDKKEFLERARQWYQEVVDFPNVQEEPPDQEPFSRILHRLDRHGVKVLVLSYPDLPNKRLEELVRRESRNVRFLSLHSVVAEASERIPLFDILNDDFVHLTNQGQKIAAAAISRVILDFATRKP